MNKQQYAEAVAEIVGGEVKEVEKANGVILTGIVIGEGKIRPTVYIDDLYNRGLDVVVAAGRVKEIAETAKKEMNLPDLSNYETAKTYLRARLYNKATKADIKRSAKSCGFDDLVIIPYLDNIIENGSAKVTRELVDKWGVSEKEIIDQAIKNSTDYEIMDMIDMMCQMADVSKEELPEEMSNNPLKVITNKKRTYGAIAVLAARKELKKMFPDGYIIIPSSIHEVLVLPYNPEASEKLTRIIGSVNDECVSEEEALGTHPYIFAA